MLLLCQAVVSQAAATHQQVSDSYQYYFDTGMQHFHHAQYQQARSSFEQALSRSTPQTKNRTVLYYNLGSVYYKLKAYSSSRDFFKKLTTDKKLASAAYYNLALIDNRLGNKNAAIHSLQLSQRLTRDKQFIVLINRQLHKLDSKRFKSSANLHSNLLKAKDWHAYLYLSPGYDSNIKFAPLGLGSGQSGRFAQLFALVDKRLTGHAANAPALFVTSSLFLSNYFSTDFNDYNLYDIGLRYTLPTRKWRNTFDINIKQSRYGHKQYQRNYWLTAKTKRNFQHGNILRLRYRYEKITSLDSVYNYLTGNRQRLLADYQLKWPRDSVLLGYELEINNRHNTLRRNYSPTRNRFRLRYERKLTSSQKIYLQTEYRRSDYTPTSIQNRLDNRSTYLLAYEYNFTHDWQFKAQWQVQNNRSSDSVFSYNRNIGLLTLRKSF